MSLQEEFLKALLATGSIRRAAKAIGRDPKIVRRWRERSEEDPRANMVLFPNGDFGAFHIGMRSCISTTEKRTPPEPEPEPEPVTKRDKPEPVPEPAPVVVEDKPPPKLESKRPVIADTRAPWESEATGCAPLMNGERPVRDGETHVHPIYGVGVRMTGDVPRPKGYRRGQQGAMRGPPQGTFGPPLWHQKMMEANKVRQGLKWANY